MGRKKFIYIGALLGLVVLGCPVYALELPKWFPFNKENALKEWQEKVFKNRVLYVVKPQEETGYLSAKSNQACSGLVYHIRFDPKKLPLMSWKWKVLKFPEKNVPVQKEKGKEKGWLERDDYAARVYVIFLSWNFMNIHSLEYVWDENLSKETVISSPYFSNLKLIVIESGKQKTNDWVFEKRNIYNDYKKAFGRAPNRPVGAVALMTDSDNTASTAEALYTDIKVGYKDE